MFNQKHYVPILKGKDGEYKALQTLDSNVRYALTPLLEVPPIPWDYDAQRPAKTIDQHLKKIEKKIEYAWGCQEPLFVDLLWIPGSERMHDGRHPLEFVFESLRECHVRAIPVTGLLRDASYIQACHEIAQKDNRGICLRVQREDFEDFSDLGSTVEQVLKELGLQVQDVDLMLDLRSISPDENTVTAEAIACFVNRLPWLLEWRTFTIAATSFPPNLIGLPASDLSFIPRKEWDIWTNILRCKSQWARIPNFSDYAISHPEPAEVDPRIMRASASVRYTCRE